MPEAITNSSWYTKKAAQKKAAEAEKNGDLSRPAKCEKCNKANRKLYRHHEDYSRPLNVTWLCRSCHESRHTALRYNTTEIVMTGQQLRRLRKHYGSQQSFAQLIGCAKETVSRQEQRRNVSDMFIERLRVYGYLDKRNHGGRK